MARNPVAAGHRVIGFVRDQSRREALRHEGIEPAVSIAALSATSDVVLTVLPDGPDVDDVVLGSNGVAESLKAGALHIDANTVVPDTARRIARALNIKKIDAVDAPVSGEESGAKAASLTIMVGGTAEAFDRAEPVLRALSASMTHVGDSGAGQIVRAASQLLAAGHLGWTAEAMTLLARSGIGQTRAVAALSGGLAGSRVLDVKSAAKVSRDFAPGFCAVLLRKDPPIMREAARERGAMTPLIESLVDAGGGNLDHSPVIREVEKLSVGDQQTTRPPLRTAT
jgi:2-hydroxy-3-oxopropionate reductase